MSETFLTDTLHAPNSNVVVVRGVLLAQGVENVKVRYVLVEEPDTVSGNDHWVIYDFTLGKW